MSPIASRPATDGPAQVEQGNGFSPVNDGEEDSAIRHMRTLGAWSARAIVLIEVVYVAVFVAGFVSIGSASAPLPDPYLAIGEIIILVMAPIMVCLMLAIHPVRSETGKAIHAGRARMDAGRRGIHQRRPLRRANGSATHRPGDLPGLCPDLLLAVAIDVLRDRHCRVGRVLRVVSPVRRTGVCA